MKIYKIKMYIKKIPIIGNFISFIKNIKIKKEEKKKINALKYSGENAVNILFNIFEENKIDAFLNFGSLLGMVRDNKFMEYDDDIDYGIIVDKKFSWENIEKILEQNNIYKVRQFKYNNVITEQTYKYENLTIDLFACFPEKENLISYFYYRENVVIYNSKYEYSVASLKLYKFNNTKIIDIGNSKYKIPENAEEYLASIYSNDWKVPNPNWNHKNGPGWNDEKDFGYIEIYNR